MTKKIVTLYPNSTVEFDSIESNLVRKKFYVVGNASGEGYSGPEGRGWVIYRKGTSQTDVVFPPGWRFFKQYLNQSQNESRDSPISKTAHSSQEGPS